MGSTDMIKAQKMFIKKLTEGKPETLEQYLSLAEKYGGKKEEFLLALHACSNQLYTSLGSSRSEKQKNLELLNWGVLLNR